MTTPANLDPFAILGATPAPTPIMDAAPPAPAAARSETTPSVALAADLPEIISGENALARAANPLLNLIPQIRVTAHHPDPAQLRNYLVEQVQLFERRAREAQVPPETIIAARYALCTALDETAAKTPWGGGGQWSRHSLLVTFHNETWGGEKFFQVLARLVQEPKKYLDLIELMAVCIALGFEGRFSVVDNGRTQLETLRRRLVEIIASARGEHSRALSLHWRGAEPDRRAHWGYLPLWLVAGATALLLVGIYLVYAFLLASRSDQVFAAIGSIRPAKVEAFKPKPASTKRLARFLEPEIQAGLVVVNDFEDRSIIILRGDGMFDSGKTEVKPRYLAILDKVAAALDSVPGAIRVVGHTDDVPIRSARFPSNYELSRARALEVQRLLEPKLKTPGRIQAEGRADAEPLVREKTPEARAQNRRVEITLLLPPEERDREFAAAQQGDAARQAPATGQGRP
ncbi:MAG: DotU family type VI secretion system protein [Casimicrobiaceae bacterium]|nr:DotU family type VI secretion system protein [Casimicrobiaceae bacterium]MDW8311713.1 DotU family type VI secretion system protein [Burkholderiales bacterium]